MTLGERKMKELSEKTSGFTDSLIRRMTRVANKYDAINLSQGYPDFDPPKEITEKHWQKSRSISQE